MQDLNKYEDERGLLVPMDFSTLPFEPKRFFYVKNVPEGTWRGGHAHHKTKQILICVKGEILVKLIGADEEKEFVIKENQSCFVDNMVWDSQRFIEKDSILLVLCSTEYESSDYILNMDEFISYQKSDDGNQEKTTVKT